MGETGTIIADKPLAASKTIWQYEYEGIRYPKFMPAEPKEHLRTVNKLKCDQGDVFVCSYPKSGTHWVLEIVNMLKRGRAMHSSKFNFLDIMPAAAMETVQSPRIFASHLRFNHLPLTARKQRAKVIYCLRNPKDLLVSLYNFVRDDRDLQYSGTWDEFFDDFLHGKVPYSSWFDHVMSWEKARDSDRKYPMLFLYYEDLKENPIREIRKVAEFLGVPVDSYLLEATLKQTSLASMKDHKYMYHPYPPELMNPKHNAILFRKGKVSDWKNWFTYEQNWKFDKFYDWKMRSSSLTFKYEIH